MGGLRSLVGGLCAAASVVTLASCSSGNDDEQSTGRLSALYNEHGHLDCRRLYAEVPVATLLDAGLTTRLEQSRGANGNDTGRSYCPSRYVGPGWPGKISVPMQVGTTSDSSRYQWVGEPEEYRGWGIGRLSMADGSVNPAAMTTVEGRGTLIIFTMDEMTLDSDPDNVFPNPLGDGTEDALRHVVDGLEDHSHDLVPEGTPTVFSDGDRFDCRLFYDRMTSTDLVDAGLDVSDERYAPHRIRDRENGAVSCDLVPQNGVNGRPDVTGDEVAGFPVEITTGPRDDHPGTPLAGDDALAGWEEYWDFAGADRPVNTANDGKEAYTARFCRSARDCITVSNFLGYSRDLVSDRPTDMTAQTVKNEVLPLLRWITERENLTDGSTDRVEAS